MMAVSPSCTRSSLEQMLESLRRREDNDCNKTDVPPALPSRPTSRARLPSAKRSLPAKFEITDVIPEDDPVDFVVKKVRVKVMRKGSFGVKRVKEMECTESPYCMRLGQNEFEQRLEEIEPANLAHESSLSNSGFRESDWNDSIAYFSKKKLSIWCPMQSGDMELGQIQSSSGNNSSILLSNGTIVTVSTSELLPANPEILDGVDDLIQLSYLNEPSVLHNLHYRYSNDNIYTKAGPVLIAINPFRDLQVCGNELIASYRQKLVDSPHVYAIADTAYCDMMRDDVDQSIIISGESGAGKTETANIALQYLAALSGVTSDIAFKILQTSCILEAFGNAKTSVNNNSSRFGKFTKVHFSAKGTVGGAKIQTFLLEKSRVVQLTHGERSYHIFYQLCAAAPSSLKDRLNIKTACEYNYLKQSGCFKIDGVDDAQNFHKLMEAMDALQICKQDQDHAFEMLAAVLWIGNISFQIVDDDHHVEILLDEAVTTTASLIGCDPQDLILVLSTRKIQAGKDSVAKSLTIQQATEKRDAFAKFIYTSLFDWLVETINRSLGMDKNPNRRSISILDIYGFESVQRNSFEQLCINYANERLQQHFNRHLFKLQQDEYEHDGIDWTKVDFEDNQECLDLIEKKPTGLIALLNEETNFPEATDLTFADKLKQHLDTNPCFEREIGGAFSVIHYAGKVVYDTSGFLEKNRDPLHYDTIQLLKSCTGQLPQLIASNILDQFKNVSNSSSLTGVFDFHKQSVGTKFKGQLFKLMQQLENSVPHFIRCIKSNNKNAAGCFDKNLVLEQLRCSGILQVVRISRSGYPTRISHQEFTRRYGVLLPKNDVSQDPLTRSIAILRQFNFHHEMYQVGYTKLYLRAGQIAELENMRNKFMQGTIEVQRYFRCHQARSHFQELKKEAITLQSFVRGENGRRQYNSLLQLKKESACKVYDEQFAAAVYLQSVIRRWLARKQFSKLQKLQKSKHDNTKSREKQGNKTLEDFFKKRVESMPSDMEELQRRILKAEDENTLLREQIRQLQVQRADHEAKMKSMEDTWQKQISSLQVSVGAAKKRINSGNSTSQPCSPSPRHHDSDDAVGNQTVNNLVKEFEQQKQYFDREAKTAFDVKSPQSPGSNHNDELRRLKFKFDAWKKEFKVKLREAKAEKSLWKWWGKKNKRIQH